MQLDENAGEKFEKGEIASRGATTHANDAVMKPGLLMKPTRDPAPTGLLAPIANPNFGAMVIRFVNKEKAQSQGVCLCLALRNMLVF
jgi:hypothetical protein